MFLLFTSNFIGIRNHEKVRWKSISDLPFLDWDCVRYLFVFLLFYCANFSNIRHEKSIYFKKIISDVPFLERDCVIYLFMFQLFSANFIDSGKHEKVTWKGISDLSFRDWDGVRCSFIFLLSAVQTSQTMGNKKELIQKTYLIYQFRNETVSGKVSFFSYWLCSANSLYIAQLKVVTWKACLKNQFLIETVKFLVIFLSFIPLTA